MISNETQEALVDTEFERSIRYIAMDFGADMTLEQLNNEILRRKPAVIRTVNGVDYRAGYNGADIIPPGKRSMKLVDLAEKGKTVKLMFADTSDRFLYHTVSKDDLSFSSVIQMTKYAGSTLEVLVHHEIIENTGNKHATVLDVEWPNQKQ
jgi:DUF971 family protein